MGTRALLSTSTVTATVTIDLPPVSHLPPGRLQHLQRPLNLIARHEAHPCRIRIGLMS